MTRTGERALIGVSITLLFIVVIISQTVWAKGSGKHASLQNPGQVLLVDAGE
jgi:nitrogen fixation-related uncharacterized protein